MKEGYHEEILEREKERAMKGLGVVKRTFCNILLVQRKLGDVRGGVEQRTEGDLRRKKREIKWKAWREK